MLTKEASTALLKTLEEPPDHVIFVLATTDPQKVLPTIRSPHAALRVLAAARPTGWPPTWPTSPGGRASRPMPRPWPPSPAGPAGRPATRCRCSTRPWPTATAQLEPEQVAALFGGTAAAARAGHRRRAGRRRRPRPVRNRLDALLGAGVDARTLADDLLRYLRDVFLVLSGPGRVRLETPEEERAGLARQGEALGTGGGRPGARDPRGSGHRDPPGPGSPPHPRGDPRPAGPA